MDGQKVDKMIGEEINKKERYTEINKYNNIKKKVRKKVNENQKELKKGSLICEKLFKDLKLHRLMTPSYRPLSKVHKNL